MDEEEAHLHLTTEATQPIDPELSKYISLIFEY
jgi:hypothetical protein